MSGLWNGGSHGVYKMVTREVTHSEFGKRERKREGGKRKVRVKSRVLAATGVGWPKDS